MGVLSDRQIKNQVTITPYEPGIKRPGVISYGQSSYGYDIRAGYVFKVFTNVWGSVVDPKAFDPKSFVDVDITPGNYDVQGTVATPVRDHVLIPPNSFALAESLEHFEIPRDTLAIVLGKSTYARCGIILNCTPLEPEWKGKITLEISNTTPLPAKIYAGEGVGQVYFLRSDERNAKTREVLLGLLDSTGFGHVADAVRINAHHEGCEVSYADKSGKYDQQKGLTLPIVD